MKTADVELTEAGKSGRSLGSLFGLSDNKKSPKFKAGTHPSAGGAASEKTQVSQSIADVLKLLRADAASKIGVHGDKGFFDSFKSAAGDIECLWLSNDFVVDQQLGALPLAGDHLKSVQAIVVGGPDVGTKYRFTLRGTLAHAPSVPVHWVADNWEFCAGTAAVPQRSRTSTRWCSITSRNSSASRTRSSSASSDLRRRHQARYQVLGRASRSTSISRSSPASVPGRCASRFSVSHPT
jgi:hypothetical protein